MVQRGMQEAAVTLSLLLTLAATPACASGGVGPRVVYDTTLSAGLDRCVLIDQSEFTLSRLEKESSDFLASNPRLKFSRLFMATTMDRALAASGKGMFHYDFGYWLERVEAESKKGGRTAELIQIGDSAVLRVEREKGQAQEIVLRGTNILHWRVNGLSVDLKWVSTSKAFLTGQISLNVALGITDALAEKDALAITEHLDAELGVRPVWYTVRADPWFVTSDSYPWVNPFYPFPGKPSREEYMKTYSYLCKPDSQSGRISCSRFGPRVP